MKNLNAFIDQCRSEGVDIKPGSLTLPFFEAFGHVHFPPSRWYEACTASMRQLGAYPGEALVSKPIPDTVSFEGVAYKALVSLLNGSIHRLDDKGLDIKDGYKDCCSEAEPHFLRTFASMQDIIEGGDSSKHDADSLADIFVNDEGQPVAIMKKSRGLLLSMSVDEIVVDGVTFPPGTMFDFWGDFYKRRDAPWGVVPLSEVSSVIPLRLSGFLEGPADRRSLFPEMYSDGIGNSDLDLDEIKDLAMRCIRHLSGN